MGVELSQQKLDFMESKTVSATSEYVVTEKNGFYATPCHGM